MKFIKASWKGYEIDSSEFSAQVAVYLGSTEVSSIIKTFCKKIPSEMIFVSHLNEMLSILEKIKLDKPSFFTQKIQGEEISNIIENLIPEILSRKTSLPEFQPTIQYDTSTWKNSSEDELITLTELTEKLVRKFPRLIDDLTQCYAIFFTVLGSNTVFYSISLTGKYGIDCGYSYVSDEEEYLSLLKSMKKEHNLKWETEYLDYG